MVGYVKRIGFCLRGYWEGKNNYVIFDGPLGMMH
jgi:hypothetical protein